MEIIVEGKGSINCKPDTVKLEFQFICKEKTYEMALQVGTSKVQKLVEILENLGIKKENFLTQSFKVYEDKVYNEKSRIYEVVGYVFNQVSYIKFDYNISLLALLIESISNIQNGGPEYKISFELKEEKIIKEKVLELAYKDALFQAQAISKASNYKIKECSKISFKPFEVPILSGTMFNMEPKMAKMMSSVQENILNSFVPEDISIEKNIYCLFIAEK